MAYLSSILGSAGIGERSESRIRLPRTRQGVGRGASMREGPAAACRNQARCATYRCRWDGLVDGPVEAARMVA
jgi:hypothetical protein